MLINPDEFSDNHEFILDYFPDNKDKAKASIASFTANCILSLEITKDEMFKLIEEYIAFYKAREIN